MSTSPLKLAGKLARLTAEVNSYYDEAFGTIRTTIHKAREMGAKLEEIATELPERGDWGRWLDEHFRGKPSSAYNYRQVNREWKKFEKQVAAGRIKFIEDALSYLRKKESTDPTKKMERDPLHTKKKELRTLLDEWFKEATADDIDRTLELFKGHPDQLRTLLATVELRRDERDDTVLLRQRAG